MKIFTHLLQPKFQIFGERKLVFDNEKAPPSPETFKATDKPNDAQIAAEVGPISPSQIASSAAARASSIKTKYINNTQFLASLMPVTGATGSGGSGGQNGQTGDDNTQGSSGQSNQTEDDNAIVPNSSNQKATK